MMSSLIRSGIIVRHCLKKQLLPITAIRHLSTKDFKPGPYPKTKEERVKAAEKYGLHPAEYEPYPDDGEGYGDYPKLPLISAENKDPYYPWDNPEHKRNFNEPMHDEFDLIREDRYNVNARFRLPKWMYWAQFFGVMFGAFGIYWLLEHVKMFHPLVPRQFPEEGKKHYTFERS